MKIAENKEIIKGKTRTEVYEKVVRKYGREVADVSKMNIHHSEELKCYGVVIEYNPSISKYSFGND